MKDLITFLLSNLSVVIVNVLKHSKVESVSCHDIVFTLLRRENDHLLVAFVAGRAAAAF